MSYKFTQDFGKHNQDTVGEYGAFPDKMDRPKKGKLRVMPISDSPWAPTGFGTNTKNISCILHEEGHHIGYGGCQNSQHGQWFTPWPLGQTEKKVYFENLPIMFPGQERFGEKSFPHWLKSFKPDLVLGHLDFQMFKHMTDMKQPRAVTLPMYGADHKLLTRKQRLDLMNQAFKQVTKGTS